MSSSKIVSFPKYPEQTKLQKYEMPDFRKNTIEKIRKHLKKTNPFYRKYFMKPKKAR